MMGRKETDVTQKTRVRKEKAGAVNMHNEGWFPTQGGEGNEG
jgi:hypothetical protein